MVEVLVEVLGKEVTNDVEKIAINFPNPFTLKIAGVENNVEIYIHFVGMSPVKIMGHITELGK